MPLIPVGVIPAAGSGSRLRGRTGSKEVQSVGGRPVMDYSIDRMRVAGCHEVRVVTTPDKADVIKHARELECQIIEARPSSAAASVEAGCEGLDSEVAILCSFPDTLWEPQDGFRRLLARLVDPIEVVLGVFVGTDPSRSDVVLLRADGFVEKVEVKPDRPSANQVWGCFVARAGALIGLGDAGEIGEFLNGMCGRGQVGGAKLSDFFLDIGTSEDFERYAHLSYDRIMQAATVRIRSVSIPPLGGPRG